MSKKKITTMGGGESSLPQEGDTSASVDVLEKGATVPQIELIGTGLIKENPLNPRKAFDVALLEGLAGNIRQQGLLHPITVRKLDECTATGPGGLAGKNMYEIVCGARRYRACKMLGMETIACIVRVMSDDEAFDAMVTENLQRKDVEPMDEAVAFAELHKRGVSIEELAARFGKSVAFITQRIRLNEIIPEFASMLEKKELQVSHALELCKLDPDQQKDIHEHSYGEKAQSWNQWNDYSVKQLKAELQNRFCQLKDATFDKTECKTCRYNCAHNSLFEEMEGCSNPRCFNRKKMEHRAKEVEKEVGRGAIFIAGSNYNSETDALVKILDEKGIEPLNLDNFDWEHKKEPFNGKQYGNESVEEYEARKALYEKEREEQQQLIESGALKPAVIAGYWGGETLAYVKEKKDVKLAGLPLEDSQAVKELEAKDKRNREIMEEKTVADLRDMFAESGYEALGGDKLPTEQYAIQAAILVACGNYCSIDKLLPGESGIMETVMMMDEGQLLSIMRVFVKKIVVDSATTWSKERQELLLYIAKLVYPEETQAILGKHEATYEKRKEKIEKQLELLVNKTVND